MAFDIKKNCVNRGVLIKFSETKQRKINLNKICLIELYIFIYERRYFVFKNGKRAKSGTGNQFIQITIIIKTSEQVTAGSSNK